jgi:hypothetical protein
MPDEPPAKFLAPKAPAGAETLSQAKDTEHSKERFGESVVCSDGDIDFKYYQMVVSTPAVLGSANLSSEPRDVPRLVLLSIKMQPGAVHDGVKRNDTWSSVVCVIPPPKRLEKSKYVIVTTSRLAVEPVTVPTLLAFCPFPCASRFELGLTYAAEYCTSKFAGMPVQDAGALPPAVSNR